jgi:hypothetical protein
MTNRPPYQSARPQAGCSPRFRRCGPGSAGGGTVREDGRLRRWSVSTTHLPLTKGVHCREGPPLPSIVLALDLPLAEPDPPLPAQDERRVG